MYLARMCYHMAANGERDASRTSVRTYVPAYQRDEWDAHADELDMSRSEYVRTMVQAGRRGFDEFAGAQENRTRANEAERSDGSPTEHPAEDDRGHEPQGSRPGNDLEERVVDQLRDDCLDWDELFDAVTDDIEESLEDTLNELQDENRVQYNGRKGGYVLLE